MRLSRRFAPVFAALALLIALPCGAASYSLSNSPGDARHARVAHAHEAAHDLFGARCHTSVDGSEAVAHCHNPYPETDRLRLHVECARWWDIDSDGPAVAADPAMTVRLSGRCWKEIRSVWVSHQR